MHSVLGSGSTFSVSIPQGLAPGPAAKDRGWYGQFSAPGVSVLLVDDNSVNLTVAQRLLERFDLTVDCASGGEESLDLLKEKKYDCVLMDHMMPGIDGVEALRQTAADTGTGKSPCHCPDSQRHEGHAGSFSFPAALMIICPSP
jgi:PleD family two-component response regulator